MSTLDRTGQRIFRAVDRLEEAVRARSANWSARELEHDRLVAQLRALSQESTRVREEHAELQRHYEDLRRRHEMLQAVVHATEERLEAVASELAELTEAS